MQFHIDNASNRAAYQQIIDQVKRDIALGTLVKEDQLPTVRQLANQLAINPNTIAKSYRLLEREGIVVPYSSLHRFAVEHCDFGPKRLTLRRAEVDPGELYGEHRIMASNTAEAA